MSWLDFALNPLPDLFAAPPGGASVKVKDALLRKRLTDQQIDIAHDFLTRDDYDAMGGMLGMASYGGRINTVAPEATASAQSGLHSGSGLQHRMGGSGRMRSRT